MTKSNNQYTKVTKQVFEYNDNPKYTITTDDESENTEEAGQKNKTQDTSLKQEDSKDANQQKYNKTRPSVIVNNNNSEALQHGKSCCIIL